MNIIQLLLSGGITCKGNNSDFCRINGLEGALKKGSAALHYIFLIGAAEKSCR